MTNTTVSVTIANTVNIKNNNLMLILMALAFSLS